MKRRLLYHTLAKYAGHKNALIITGMRQVGKTTLMKQLYEGLDAKRKIWFDMDNPLDQKIFEDIDYNGIYETLRKATAAGSKERLHVFIDEMQNLPDITKVIKYMIDHYSVKFFLTGSSNFYLKNLFPESLSGRKFLYVLPPLSFTEYLFFNDVIKEEETVMPGASGYSAERTVHEYKKREKHFSDYMMYGGFPEVTLTPDAPTKTMTLKNIFASFFEKDIRIISDIRDIRELRDLIFLLVPRVGSMLDITKISAELGVARLKVYEYLDLLQSVFFIRLIPKLSASVDRSVAGGKKIYFSDTGLLNIIGRVNDGQMLENTVANQLASLGEVSFYNYRNTSEIDFILDKKTAFEVKWKGTEHDLNHLKKTSSGLNIKEHFVISYAYHPAARIVYPMFL